LGRFSLQSYVDSAYAEGGLMSECLSV
jgi:hypothetical protein